MTAFASDDLAGFNAAHAENVVPLPGRGRGGGGGAPPEGDSGGDAACPVTPLGTWGGRYWFFGPSGELREMTAQALGQFAPIASLFDGDTTWLQTEFPQTNKEGAVVGFNVRLAGAHLMRIGAREGLFRQDEPRRGIGVWRAGGRVAVHLGTEVLFREDGAFAARHAGFRDHGALWPAWPRAATAPRSAAAIPAVQAFRNHLDRWNWERIGDADVWFGLWAAGLLGAATRWRPHALVVGAGGSGKSSLMEFTAAASPLARAFNDYTEPGLRRDLTASSAPVLLDEAEGDALAAQKLAAVIGLLRRASGGTGARKVQGGGVDGGAQVFEVQSPAMLGAIRPPALEPQDAMRITRVDLQPRNPDMGGTLPSEAEVAVVKAAAMGFLFRAIEGLPVFEASLAVMREELLSLRCSPRLADQVGTIFAARHAMLRDEPLKPLEAAEVADAFRWLVVTEEQQRAEGAGMDCLLHLLGSATGGYHGGERTAIGLLVAKAMDDALNIEQRHALRDMGLLVTPYPDRKGGDWRDCHLLVANTHPRLAPVFADSRWAGARWRDDLRSLPGAWVPEDSVKFGGGGGKPRCVVVPGEVVRSVVET